MGEWWGFLRGLVRGQKGVREKKRATVVLDAFKATRRHGAVVGAGTRSRHEAGAGGNAWSTAAQPRWARATCGRRHPARDMGLNMVADRWVRVTMLQFNLSQTKFK
jgi:hypothetical protein